MKKFIIVALVLLTGCKSTAGSLQTRANIVELERDNKSITERADELASHITGLEGIDKASVVITGNTAMVGIGLAGELDDQKLMRLKVKVEKEVKRLDPSLTHVAVTASGELVERINDLADSVVTDEDDTPPKTTPELERVIESLTPPM